uniref:Uncharacterized protein n=1 Tax=Rhizophora mucronata TaxID=61149 RepID=A0A2P2LLC3_RHIMU
MCLYNFKAQMINTLFMFCMNIQGDRIFMSFCLVMRLFLMLEKPSYFPFV